MCGNINLLIAGNDSNFIDTILSYLERFDDVQVLDIARKYEDVIEKVLGNDDITAMILDLDLDGKDAMIIYDDLIFNDRKLPTIVLSERVISAQQAYDREFVDVVEKKCLFPSRFKRAIRRLKREMGIEVSQSQEFQVALTTTDDIIYKTTNEITYFETNRFQRGTVLVHTENNEEIEITTPIKVYEKHLRDRDFIRIHKSYLVNIKHIVDIDKQKVMTKNKINLPVSADRFTYLMSAWSRYKSTSN